MKYLPCDQFALDMLEASKSLQDNPAVTWKPSLTMLVHMVEDVDRMRVSGTDGRDLIEYVLEMHEPLAPEERAYYARVLETVLERRYKFRERIRNNAKRGRYVPFAPR